MRHIFAALLAASLAVGVGSTSRAQDIFAADGSFGGGYIQHYPGYLYGPHGDRWYAYFGNPPPAAAYMIAPAAPEEERVYTRGYDQTPAPYRRALPRGRATLPNGLPPSGYVPGLRGQTYGWGYGTGPYGTNYYSGMYKGWPIP